MAGIEAVTKIIGRGIAEQIFAQLEGKKTADSGMTRGNVQREQRSSDENDNNGQSTLSHFHQLSAISGLPYAQFIT